MKTNCMNTFVIPTMHPHIAVVPAMRRVAIRRATKIGGWNPDIGG